MSNSVYDNSNVAGWNVTIGSKTYRVAKVGKYLWMADNWEQVVDGFVLDTDYKVINSPLYPNGCYMYNTRALLSANDTPITAIANMLPSGWRLPKSVDINYLSTFATSKGKSKFAYLNPKYDWITGTAFTDKSLAENFCGFNADPHGSNSVYPTGSYYCGSTFNDETEKNSVWFWYHGEQNPPTYNTSFHSTGSRKSFCCVRFCCEMSGEDADPTNYGCKSIIGAKDGIYESNNIYNNGGGAYEVRKGNLVTGLGAVITGSAKNDINLTSYIVGHETNTPYQILNANKKQGEVYTISFRVTDCDATTLKRFIITNEPNSSVEYKGVGFYQKTFACLNTVNNVVIGFFSSLTNLTRWMETDKHCVIKDIKLERNTCATTFCYADEDEDNRVLIGKHKYHTKQIGNLIWTTENLDEDLKGLRVENVDWMPFVKKNMWLNVRDTDYHIGDVLNSTPASVSSFDFIEIPVSGGEVINVDVTNRVQTSLYSFVAVDSDNRITLLQKSDVSNTIVIPNGSVKLYLTAYKSSSESPSFVRIIQSSHTSEGTWQGYYNNDPSYGTKGYGKLYTFDCICSANETPSPALASMLPDGWRVPTKADFEALINAVGGASQYAKFKEKWYWQTAGTNDSGFSAIPAGRKTAANFEKFGEVADIWSSTNGSSEQYAYRIVVNNGSNVVLYNIAKSYSLSVRLVRDAPTALSLGSPSDDVSDEVGDTEV